MAPDAGRILLRNVFGWFERTQRGVYQLTAAGRKHLVAERSRWEQMAAAITMILERPRESEA